VDQLLGESVTLADCGLPAKLDTVILHKIAIADMVGVNPNELMDAQLIAEACSTAEGKAGDIVGLAGCSALCDMCCLVWLEQMQVLGISGCAGISTTPVAKVIADNRALSYANLLKNGIDANQANALVSILKGHPALKSLCGSKGDEAALAMSGKMYGVGSAEIIGNGALSLLNLALNNLRAEGTELLAAALKGNQIITELNISSNAMALGSAWGDMASGVITRADVISDMGALSKIIFGGVPKYVYVCRKYEDIEPATPEVGMLEADFSNKSLGAGGAIFIAAWGAHSPTGIRGR
jgi:hypothetical protein